MLGLQDGGELMTGQQHHRVSGAFRLAAAVLAAMAGASAANAGSPAASYPYSASMFFGAGGVWTSDSNGDYDIASIVAGGDFVLPLRERFNLQLGGALRSDSYHYSFYDFSYNLTSVQGSAIAFWRDPDSGVLGAEAGLFAENQFSGKFVKLGGVAEIYPSQQWTIGAFGGGLVPIVPAENKFSWYAGGHTTHYLSDDFAISAQVAFQDIKFYFGDYQSLRVGGELRYLTPLDGLELAAAGYYHRCQHDDPTIGSFVADGAEALLSLRIHLGGTPGSLMTRDRSGTLDTRTWTCDAFSFL